MKRNQTKHSKHVIFISYLCIRPGSRLVFSLSSWKKCVPGRNMSNEVKQSRISLDKQNLELVWADTHLSRFNVKWLRFFCRCKKCVPEFKGLYLVDIPAFPEEMNLLEVDVGEKGTNLSIQISGEIYPDHVIKHPAKWLRERCNCDACLHDVINARDVISRYGISAGVREMPKMTHSELGDDEGVFKWAKTIMEVGFCLIKQVPLENGIVVEIAKKLSPLLETTYGKYIDIRLSGGKHGSNNKGALPLHMDQPSYESCPGVLLLHCLKFDKTVSGGNSRITDAFYAAEILRKESPGDFKTLTEVPASFDIVNYNITHPCHMEHQKCHIVLDYFGKIVGVTWNPDQFAPVRLRQSDVDRYFKAHRKFSEILNRPENQITFRLEAGDVMVVNNRRCVHGREKIVADCGSRHMQTCFLDLDDVKSKYMYLGHKLSKNLTPPKVGNTCSF